MRDSDDIGISARKGTSLTVENVTVSGHDNTGIAAIRHSFISIDTAAGNVVTGNILQESNSAADYRDVTIN